MTIRAARSEYVPELEFWFEFASNYSYLSVMRIEEEARRHGVRIVWKPFLLGPIFRALGMENSPFVLQKEKGAYMRQDMARRCRKYDLAPWAMPSTFPRPSVLPSRIALLGASQPWIGHFCRKVMERNFALDRDIHQPEDLAPILVELDLPVTNILQEAQFESAKTRLREQTEVARRRGIFGAPTFFVGEEMFWGDDRLDEVLQFASEQEPAAGRTETCPDSVASTKGI